MFDADSADESATATNRANELERAALGWLQRDSGARAMVDDGLMLLWSNAAAHAIFTARRDIEVRQGFLAPIDRGQQDGLYDFIEAATDKLSTWCVERASRDGCLLLRARRVGRVIGLCLVEAGEDFRPTYHDLDKAFGLTISENRVLLDLLGGNEAEALAKMHGVSVETTRTHIRNIYSKLGVTSRERLFFKVQPFRI